MGVLSRRSRFCAGPRFLKRGIDSNGNVANEVETELFAYKQEAYGTKLLNFGSYMYYRGSVPFYWGHANIGFSPKPEIRMDESKDPLFFATDKHFERLFKTYGAPISILNLVKKDSNNEKKLGMTYDKYIERVGQIGKNYVKTEEDLLYKWLDFFKTYHSDEEELLVKMQVIAKETAERTKFNNFNFENEEDGASPIKSIQSGIMRINCVDCLDRTNNAMSCMSSVFLTLLLQGMDVNMGDFYSQKTMAVRNELLELVLNVFGQNGDKIANQYAGSEAFHKAQVFKQEHEWRTLKQNIALIAVKRYFSNVLMDNEKQRSIWLFLGDFMPTDDESEDLWNISPIDKELEEKLKKTLHFNNQDPLKEILRVSEGKLEKMYLYDKMAMPHVDNFLVDMLGDLDYDSNVLDLDSLQGVKEEVALPTAGNVSTLVAKSRNLL